MNISLLLIGFILCALASFTGAFFGVRTLSDNTKPLRFPIYADIKEAVERKREEAEQKESEIILSEYFNGE